jgi:outer membrane protein TolC
MTKLFISILLFFGIAMSIQAQEKLVLDLPQIIDIASKQSITAFRNKNMYLASYWEFRNYKADRLPSVSLSSNPLDLRRYRNKEYNFDTNEDEYRYREYINSDIAISATQNVGLTGGSVFLNSELDLVRNLSGDNSTSFSSTPISIGYSQDINGYNALKWESKIEPLKFEVAKKEFIQNMENLRVTASVRFFSLINAQIQKGIAEMNYSNADTLYRIGKGRFQVGTVTQDELLELELTLLNSEQALSMADLDEKRAQATLNSFLGLPKETIVQCIVPTDIPKLQIDPALAIDQAIKNNPTIIEHQQEKLEQDEYVAIAKSERGLQTSLYAVYGLNQSADSFDEVYKNPDKSQIFSLGLSIPILDWGSAKGEYLVAKSNREVALATIEQERIDFEQDIYQSVLEFNLQGKQVSTSAKADTVAQMGYKVTFQRFMIGKIDVIKLNIASSAQETARMAYIERLKDYWVAYFNLRSLTLFDFENQQPLAVDYDKLLEK